MWLLPLLPAALVTLVWRQLSSSWMRLRSWSPVWIFNSLYKDCSPALVIWTEPQVSISHFVSAKKKKKSQGQAWTDALAQNRNSFLGWVLREILDMFPKTNVWKQRRMLTILKMIGLDNAPYYFSLKKRRKGNVCPIISCMTHHSLHQFSSVAQLCLILCDPMDYSVPGFPVHHQFFIHIL